LKQALDHAHAKSSGSARTPVIVETVYVEDGDTRTDVSLYEVGFSWKREFLAGWRVRLTGVALSRRGLAGEQGPLLERAWAQSRRRFAVDVAIPPG
jgi:hypothetical protein